MRQHPLRGRLPRRPGIPLVGVSPLASPSRARLLARRASAPQAEVARDGVDHALGPTDVARAKRTLRTGLPRAGVPGADVPRADVPRAGAGRRASLPRLADEPPGLPGDKRSPEQPISQADDAPRTK